MGKHLLWVLLLGLSLPSGTSAQDFRVLSRTGPLDPNANLLPQSLPPGVAAPRVILAGDSWAQYMWDDGSHNDIFDRYGHAEKLALSQSVGTNPGPGYTGSGYAVSGSEARNWVDTVNYPYLANLTAALNANPTVDVVLLSVGGNDVLAGRSDGGWYKDMDLDVPGSEAALFQQIHDDTFVIIDAAKAVRPDLEVLLSSYDYPNFNVGAFCSQYACPERENLSRDPVNDLITDVELNGMMITVETQRIAWTGAADRVAFDNSVGLMHYFYGDGVTGPLLLPRPGLDAPDYLPFPGGNPLRPTLRSNFRPVYFLGIPFDSDPIHLNKDGYQRKIAQETEGYFFPRFRGDALQTFFSQGGAGDGWTDGTTTGTEAIRIGDSSTGAVRGIVSFDTSALPDGATVTGARFYLTRATVSGTNPFIGTSQGIPRVDVVSGSFGGASVEAGDAAAPADFTDAGFLAGTAKAEGYAVGVEIDPAALGAINTTGLTQFRMYFPSSPGTGNNRVAFFDGDGGSLSASVFASLADYMGNTAPFLDVSYSLPVGIGDDQTAAAFGMLPSSPNPFRSSTSIRFTLARDSQVSLRVYDIQGRRVATLKNEVMTGGGHAVTWSGRDDEGMRVSSGIYLARLVTETGTETARLVFTGN